MNGAYRFESHPRLQLFSFKSIDYNFLVFVRITNLGTFGNSRKKSLLQTLNCTPVCVWNRMRVEVQRGFDSSVSQPLLRDPSGHADIVRTEAWM
jgi:hypothetical protein